MHRFFICIPFTGYVQQKYHKVNQYEFMRVIPTKLPLITHIMNAIGGVEVEDGGYDVVMTDVSIIGMCV